MNSLSRLSWFALAICFAPVAVASEAPCESCPQSTCVEEESPPSWIFRRSTYTNDPVTGARVAQYERIPPVEPLSDERNVTSSYRRTQTNLRGTDGSSDTYYQVQAWGNGRGGLDAEWERFHDAWKESFLQGGYYNYNQGPGYGGGNRGPFYDNGYYGGSYGGPGYGPGYGNGYPGYGYPGGGWGGSGNWGPRQGPWPNNGRPGPYGGGNPNNGPPSQHSHNGNGQ